MHRRSGRRRVTSIVLGTLLVIALAGVAGLAAPGATTAAKRLR